MTVLSRTCGAIFASLLMTSTAAFAANIASDNGADPAYASGWLNNTNGGTGFSGWTLNPSPNNNGAGFFIGTSDSNGGGNTGNINNAGKSFGMYGNSAATRQFTGGALSIGQSFQLKMDNGFVDTGTSLGFGLQGASGPRFEFFFAGGTNNYNVNGSVGQLTSHAYTPDGMSASFTLTGAETYSFSITFNTGAPTTETFTGSLKGAAGEGLQGFRLFDSNNTTGANWDLFYNDIAVVPEPSTSVALGILSGVGCLWLSLRRRRTA